MKNFKKSALACLLSLGMVSVHAGNSHLNSFADNWSGHSVEYVHDGGLGTAGTLNEVTRFLVDQLAQNRDLKNLRDNPIGVTSIVKLNDFKETNKIGLWLTENLMHELHTRGFKPIDFKVMPAIQVTPNGDFVMSREVKELRDKYNINQVVTGTFAEYQHGVMINLRMIDMNTSVVTSSAQANISRATYLNLMSDVRDNRPKIVIEDKVIPAVTPNEVELRGKQFCDPSEPCFYK